MSPLVTYDNRNKQILPRRGALLCMGICVRPAVTSTRRDPIFTLTLFTKGKVLANAIRHQSIDTQSIDYKKMNKTGLELFRPQIMAFNEIPLILSSNVLTSLFSILRTRRNR